MGRSNRLRANDCARRKLSGLPIHCMVICLAIGLISVARFTTKDCGRRPFKSNVGAGFCRIASACECVELSGLWLDVAITGFRVCRLGVGCKQRLRKNLCALLLVHSCN